MKKHRLVVYDIKSVFRALMSLSCAELFKSNTSLSLLRLHPRRACFLQARVCVQSPALFWFSRPPPGSPCSASLASNAQKRKSKHFRRLHADSWTLTRSTNLQCNSCCGSEICSGLMNCGCLFPATELQCVPLWPEYFLQYSITDVFWTRGILLSIF